MSLSPETGNARRAVFFDRDGVLNVDSGYVFRREDFVWRPTAIESVKWLNDHGVLVFVVTNQSGVARGLYREEDVRRLHDDIQAMLGKHAAHIDEFRYCPHHPEGELAAYRLHCACRKPRSGMIEGLLRAWRLDSADCWLFGDRSSDLEAAQAAGVRAEHVTQDRRLIDIVRAALTG